MQLVVLVCAINLNSNSKVFICHIHAGCAVTFLSGILFISVLKYILVYLLLFRYMILFGDAVLLRLNNNFVKARTDMLLAYRHTGPHVKEGSRDARHNSQANRSVYSALF